MHVCMYVDPLQALRDKALPSPRTHFNMCVCLHVNVHHHVSLDRSVVCPLQVLQDKEFSIRDEIKLNQQVNQQRSVHGSFLQIYLWMYHRSVRRPPAAVYHMFASAIFVNTTLTNM